MNVLLEQCLTKVAIWGGLYSIYLNMFIGIQCAGWLYPVLQAVKHRFAQKDQLNKCDPEVRILTERACCIYGILLLSYYFITKLGKHTFIVKLVIEETFSNISYPKLLKLLRVIEHCWNIFECCSFLQHFQYCPLYYKETL